MATSGADLLVVVYQALSSEEQDAGFERLAQLRLDNEAGTQSEGARYLRSLRRVTEVVGHFPTADEYRATQPELVSAGEDVESFSRVYHFYGSWSRAYEAVELSATTTAKRIHARFRERRLGKVWRYTEDTLRDTLEHAAEHWGRPPSVAEFEWWRERELEVAVAAGNDDIHLPSANPYRRRYKTWEGALLHFGFTPEEIAKRLESPMDPAQRTADPYLPDGLPVAALVDELPEDLPLSPEQAKRAKAAYEAFPARTRYVLTVRLGLGGARKLTLKQAARPLVLSLDRVRQIQVFATNALADAAAGEGRSRPNAQQFRDHTVELIMHLANGTEQSS